MIIFSAVTPTGEPVLDEHTFALCSDHGDALIRLLKLDEFATTDAPSSGRCTPNAMILRLARHHVQAPGTAVALLLPVVALTQLAAAASGANALVTWALK